MGMSQNNSKTPFLTIYDPRSSTFKSVSDCHLSVVIMAVEYGIGQTARMLRLICTFVVRM